jgi:hypothetical protein
MRNITNEKAALEEALVTMEHDGLTGRDFLSGTSEPNLGDLAVFGTLRSIEGLPAHTRVIDERAGPLQEWYGRMREKVDAVE